MTIFSALVSFWNFQHRVPTLISRNAVWRKESRVSPMTMPTCTLAALKCGWRYRILPDCWGRLKIHISSFKKVGPWVTLTSKLGRKSSSRPSHSIWRFADTSMCKSVLPLGASACSTDGHNPASKEVRSTKCHKTLHRIDKVTCKLAASGCLVLIICTDFKHGTCL